MKVFWFDTETSGTDPVRNGILTLAYLVEIDGQIVDRGELFNNPVGKELDEQALKVNRIDPGRIPTFPIPSETHRRLDHLFETYVSRYDKFDKFYAGGFNVHFDLAFLRQLWLDCGDQYFGSWFFFGEIDPARMIAPMRYAGLLPGFNGNAKLAELAEYFEVSAENAHDAIADIDMTRSVALEMIGRIRGATV